MGKTIKQIQMFCAGLLAALILLLPAASATATVIDRVVAEVNGQIITLSELEAEMATIGEDFLRGVPAGERAKARQEAQSQVLSGMIDQILVERQAQRRGIFVGEREIDAAMAQIMEDNRLSREELIRELERSGTTLEQYRQTLRTQILQARLLNLEVRERIVIPENRIRRYYEEHYADGSQQQGYHLLQMGFAWDGDDQNRAEAKQRATGARDRVLTGGSFRQLARELSDLPSATSGGDLGVFEQDELADEMRRHILAMTPGELTPIMEIGGAYQFFKLLAGGGVSRPYEDMREEIREILYQQALEENFERWVSNLREDVQIRILL
ncbi:peptidylprolyl isomerase [Desulfurivibrio alkaliphilus]|uniref:SurA domain protein n=1 Tax=Desulfurivibrio alkaliphilus (strain DSM 19089 / UNIQEM U267 / AHT2) TaxID=589865 RepID=D6Z381_DESAT|nr:SurA N-terminal domain-containing protein [Desulfurivibrio alkaliphilus]ADH86006.1 SurA domain protein [Desulfurivibrio alkaliphilus AHT 2]